MKRKERRVRLLLELFFMAAGLYVLVFKAWGYFEGIEGSLFENRQGAIPIFNLAAHVFTGLSCFIASSALWVRASWAAGWSMFTFGMLLYGNLHSIGLVITEEPAQTIPMIIIVLVVMQSFPFLIRETRRYP